MRCLTLLMLVLFTGNAGAQTLAERIASAREGATVRLEAGVYHGPVRLDRPVTLEGEPGAVIDGGGRGDIITISVPGVTVRGLTIRNTGIDLDQENCAIRVLAGRTTIENNTLDDVLFGIDLKEAPDSVIRGNRVGGKDLDVARRGDGIRLWRADRSLVENNVIHDGRDTILWYSEQVVLRNNTAHACRYGLHLMFSNGVTLEGNHLERNSVGVYFMYSNDLTLRRNTLTRNRGPSGYGIGLKESDRYRIEENVITGNRVGVYLDGSPMSGYGELRGNTLAANDVGIMILPSAKGNTLTGNNFIDNIDQVAVSGRGDAFGNEFAVGGRGNFWSDYAAYDADRDGVGDVPYESNTLFENLIEREPKLRVLMFSPAQQALELVGRAVPAVQPEPKFDDPFPLMRPVEMSWSDATPVRRLPLASASALLLGVAGLLLLRCAAFRDSRALAGPGGDS